MGNFWIVPLLHSVSDMYTQFRLALDLPERNCYVSREVYTECVRTDLITHIPHMYVCPTR